MKLFLPLYFSVFFLATRCKSVNYTPSDYEGQMITIGTGGGFTGLIKEYTILSNGQFFYGNGNGNYTMELDRFDKKHVKQLFKNYKLLGFDDINIDKPGNMYHYLLFKDKDNMHKIQWGAHDSNAPAELLIYFANLKNICNQAKKEKVERSSNLKTEKR